MQKFRRMPIRTAVGYRTPHADSDNAPPNNRDSRTFKRF